MKESKTSSEESASLKPVSRPQTTVLQAARQSIADLDQIRNELWLVLSRTDNYVLALEKLLEGKLSPTKSVADLRSRLREAKNELTEIKQDFQGIDEFLDSTTAKYLVESTENPDRPEQE